MRKYEQKLEFLCIRRENDFDIKHQLARKPR